MLDSPTEDSWPSQVHQMKYPPAGVHTFPPSPPPSPPTSSQYLTGHDFSTPHADKDSSEQSAPFLQLPFDIIYSIADHLDPISTHALSLLCRATYNLNLPSTKQVLDTPTKRQLLTLLESDHIGEKHFYCRPCNRLHPFASYWGPHSAREHAEEPEYHCGQRDKFCPPCGNNSDLAFYHARLALNAHRWGPAHGIAAENLLTSHDVPRDAVTIRCATDAVRVIHGELFLLRSYKFHLAATNVVQFRASTGLADFRVCEHTPFFKNSSVYHQSIPELSRRPSAAGLDMVDDSMVECKDAEGSCGLCLMDYEVSIEHAGRDWNVSIRAYHNVGSCRSPEDWKWARFSEKGKLRFFLPNRPNRRGSSYGPGVIKQAWAEHEQSEKS